ncbi:hypothetical protein EB796_002844 [Bugula neritina]|uniref:Uncharacterized protein n=1 Tax=Bugula neritina TaxID=10212 RepID=A0A7J7KJF7_BUGNE|nr:hypothetical protein EB796_002844 [Bugula neritina]
MATAGDVPSTTKTPDTTDHTNTGEVNEQLVQLRRAQMLHISQPKKRPIPAPTYDGTTDVETFLRQFDSIAAHNTWETDERGLWLTLALRGEAAKCVVSDHDAEIRNQLLQRHGLRESRAYLMLKKIKFRLGEDLNMFICQLRRILSTAHPNLDENELEAMAIKELLTQIPANQPAMWALRVKPHQCARNQRNIRGIY